MSSSPELETAYKIRDFLISLCEDLGGAFIVIGGWAVHAYGAKEFSLVLQELRKQGGQP